MGTYGFPSFGCWWHMLRNRLALDLATRSNPSQHHDGDLFYDCLHANRLSDFDLCKCK